MNSLLLKDFLILKKKTKILPIIILVALSVIAIYFWKSLGLLIVNILLVFYSTSFILPLFTEDIKDEWLDYVKTLPISNKSVIQARYIITYSIVLLISLFNFFIDIIYAVFDATYSLDIYLLVVLMAMLIGIIYSCVLIPSVYYAGINGSSFALLLILGFFSFIQLALKNNWLKMGLIGDFGVPIILGIFFLLAVLLSLLSMKISNRIIRNQQKN